MANIPTAWLRPPQDQMAAMLGGVLNNSILDKVAAMFGALFVHVRGLPMFSFLLGYGVGMLALSLHRRGYPSLQARKVLIRRYGFLAFFGFLHSFFIFFGDIMFSYGVLGIFLVLMMRWRTQSLIVVAITLYSMYALSMMAVALTTVFMPDGGFALPQPTVGFRLPVTWNEYVISGVYATFNQFTILIPSFFFLLPLMMMGFVAARHQVLEKPQEHLKLLKTTVAVGVLVILVVGIPWGLSEL
ncbi:MAG: DUF418 domain-containing protein, partial [Corynebacterium sp.]|nr:DUF418 domain-containing protein [Corynebacterium sp.]